MVEWFAWGAAMVEFRVSLVFVLFGISGCANVPIFDTPSPFTVAHIVDKIECEVAQAARDNPRLRDEKWVALADLTLQVDDTIGLAPKLSFIRPLAKEGTNFTFGAEAELKRQRQRIYTETLELPISKASGKSCYTRKDLYDLTGDLGIVETVSIGLSSYSSDDAVAFPVTADQKSAFGETIQFIITRNVSGVGPTWTLVHFVGPGGVLNAERVDTHKLIISFAQGRKAAGPSGRRPRLATPTLPAIDRAADQNRKMLLQSLPLFRSTR